MPCVQSKAKLQECSLNLTSRQIFTIFLIKSKTLLVSLIFFFFKLFKLYGFAEVSALGRKKAPHSPIREEPGYQVLGMGIRAIQSN